MSSNLPRVSGGSFCGAQVLVTGGAGFIGSHLNEALLSDGASVRVLDNLANGDFGRLPAACTFIKGDVRDARCVAPALRGVDFVFHQAAQINPATAVDNPLEDCLINVVGTLNVLIEAKKAGVAKVIMASTNVYADAEGCEPWREDASVLSLSRSLLSPYAAAKVSAEAYLKVFNDEFALPTVRLRYSNVYGSRQTDASGSGVIAIFARHAFAGQPLRVFGDGQQTRDFVHVSDVVAANLSAAMNRDADGHVFNVARGEEISVAKLATMIKSLTRSQSPIVGADVRAADFRRAVISIAAARQVLGWSPRVRLEDGLIEYLDWYATTIGERRTDETGGVEVVQSS